VRVPTKLGFKNPKHVADLRDQQNPAAIGKTRATTGSAGSEFDVAGLGRSAIPQPGTTTLWSCPRPEFEKQG
jgi:hypothetical protein